jgi:uncharacterized protein
MGRALSAKGIHTDLWRVAALTMMNKPDLNRAILEDASWIRSAAACGIASAQVRLGRMLLEGEGVPQDRVAAFENFRTAAAQGDSDGHNLLGRCYENGWGVAISHTSAAYHYQLAAEAGLDWAQYNLGHMRLSGYGGPQNRQEAFYWYARSAMQGHVRAMNLMGRCHEQGWGTPKDPIKAQTWYRRSALGGYFRGAYNYASVLIDAGCVTGAIYWFGRSLQKAPEPSRSFMLASLVRHMSPELRALGNRVQRVSQTPIQCTLKM